MKKRDRAAEIAAYHIDEVTDDYQRQFFTDKQLRAAHILRRCMAYISQPHHPSPFTIDASSNGKHESGDGLWMLGDLEGGTGGKEFTYAYLPTKFVEGLIDIAEPIPTPLREIYVTAATVYFLNAFDAALDEAVTNLLFEAGSVVVEMLNSDVEEHTRGEDALRCAQERFQAIIGKLLVEGNGRRRQRLKSALWEIDPGKKAGRPAGALTSEHVIYADLLQRLMNEYRSREDDDLPTDADTVAKSLGLSNRKQLREDLNRLGVQDDLRTIKRQALSD